MSYDQALADEIRAREAAEAERDALKAAVERVREYLDALIANGFGATDNTLRALRIVLAGPPAEEKKDDLRRPLSSRHEALLWELLALSRGVSQPPAEKEGSSSSGGAP